MKRCSNDCEYSGIGAAVNGVDTIAHYFWSVLRPLNARCIMQFLWKPGKKSLELCFFGPIDEGIHPSPLSRRFALFLQMVLVFFNSYWARLHQSFFLHFHSSYQLNSSSSQGRWERWLPGGCPSASFSEPLPSVLSSPHSG